MCGLMATLPLTCVSCVVAEHQWPLIQPCTMQVELVYDTAALAVDPSQGSPCVPGSDLAASHGSLVCNWWSTPGLVLLNALTDGQGAALQSSQAGPPLERLCVGGTMTAAGQAWQMGLGCELGAPCCGSADACSPAVTAWGQQAAAASKGRCMSITGDRASDCAQAG